MDIAIFGALSGVLGSFVGGTITAATAWISHKSSTRRDLIREETHKREVLYGEFIGECAKLLLAAYSHPLEKPETLLPAYALVNRIRLTASPNVLKETETLVRNITEQFFASNMSIEELHRMVRSGHSDPLQPFGEACRIELSTMLASL